MQAVRRQLDAVIRVKDHIPNVKEEIETSSNVQPAQHQILHHFFYIWYLQRKREILRRNLKASGPQAEKAL